MTVIVSDDFNLYLPAARVIKRIEIDAAEKQIARSRQYRSPPTAANDCD